MKKIKVISVIFSLSILIVLSCQMDKKSIKNQLSNQKYDSVVVYIYDGFTGQEIVDSGRHLDSTVVAHLNLDNSQINELSLILTQKRVIKNDSLDEEAACCSPHHGIVFYKNQKPYQWISMCFDCNCVYSTFKAKVHPARLINFFKSLHLKVGGKELVPMHFGRFDPNDDIRNINRGKYGKTYDSIRHNL